TIRTSAGEHRASRAVVCAGAWVGRVLPGVVPNWVERQVQFWFRARRPEEFAPGRAPIFIRKRGGRDLYGFPTLDGQTVKVAAHHGGAKADPDRLDRQVHEADRERVSDFVRDSIRGLDPDPVRSKVCMYTNSPDGDFVIGAVPGHSRLTVLGGMSGHGFKFATVMGEIAADLATDGETRHPIEPFGPERFPTPD
ncbi:MAG TPA: FAD-dependent oxidoreductase, partial [Candidatus Dormibacteraeota bacterium]|nr:FAD-dependent oxidoreductase [Candidatus Dormibacteraeota bacterium]